MCLVTAFLKMLNFLFSGKNLILNLHFVRFLLNTWLIESTLQSLTGNWKNHGETEVQKQNSICYLSENKMVRQFSWDAPTQQDLLGGMQGPPPLKKSWAQTHLVNGEKSWQWSNQNVSCKIKIEYQSFPIRNRNCTRESCQM
jgi:hypothetical protein